MDLEEKELGLNTSQIKSLKEAGFSTIEALASATIRELMDIPSIGEKTADHLWKYANEKLIPERFISAAKFMEIHEQTIQRVTTGSKAFDDLLGGGVESGSINEIAGEEASGKTQLAHQLSVNIFLPKENGGLGVEALPNIGVLYFDTENGFKAKRIADMAKAKNLNVTHVLEHIIIAEAYSSDHQIFLLNHSDNIIKDNNVKLIIVDSLTSHFRSEYIGREMLAPRQQSLNSYLRKLLGFARTFNIIVLVTNQAIQTPDLFTASHPAGGHIAGHQDQTRVWLKRPSDSMKPIRIAQLLKSVYLPSRQITFKITETGISDVEEPKKPSETKEKETKGSKQEKEEDDGAE